jgi:predicted ArsR family transcriptional regulator
MGSVGPDVGRNRRGAVATNADDPALQQQARALGDPTRYRLFRFITDAGRPLRVKELVAEVGLHHTIVRQHLGALRDAGLLEETTERGGRPGRPHLLYRTSAAAAARWTGPAPYEQLSVMLLEMLTSGTPPRGVGRHIGAEAAERVAASGEQPAIGVVRELARLGFDPKCREDGDTVEVVLQHCPMAAAAQRWPDIVCALHHGMVEALATRLGAGEVREFTPAEAVKAGCRLRLVPAPTPD